MGEMSYNTNHNNEVEFYDDPLGRYGCLCTFPFNYQDKSLGAGTIASLALLGAAIAIDANTGGFDKECYHDNCSRSGRTRYTLPECVPLWIRNEIRRNLNLCPEEETILKNDEDDYDCGFDYIDPKEIERKQKLFGCDGICNRCFLGQKAPCQNP